MLIHPTLPESIRGLILTLSLSLIPVLVSAQTPVAEIKNNSDVSLFRVDENGGLVVLGGPGTIPVEGAGTRMMWYPAKGSFRAGTVNFTQWDDESIAQNSVAMGENTVASGISSTAMGESTVASGLGSLAVGQRTTASGLVSTAMGRSAEALHDRTFVWSNNEGGGYFYDPAMD